MKKFALLFFLFLEIFMLVNSKTVVLNFNKTLNICMYNLMPSMFFSIFLTSTLISLNIEKYIPKFLIRLSEKLFKISEEETIILFFSSLSGYPNNSKMLSNTTNCNNIINYCHFVSPIFMISTVNNLYLKNTKVTLIILFSHIFSSLILGIILRDKNKEKDGPLEKQNNSLLNIYYDNLKNTTMSLALIFSNILFFSIIISIFKTYLPFNRLLNAIIIGVLEFSSGIYEISMLNIDIFLKGLLILIIITFSSLSMHMQVISFNRKIKYINFLKYRIINVFLSILIYVLIYFTL